MRQTDKLNFLWWNNYTFVFSWASHADEHCVSFSLLHWSLIQFCAAWMQHRSKRELSKACQRNDLNTSFLLVSLLYTTPRIDFINKTKKKTHHAAWQDTQPLSHLCKGSPTEVVARLLKREALTALPKANFNLFQQKEKEMSGKFLIVYSLFSWRGCHLFLSKSDSLAEEQVKAREVRRSFASDKINCISVIVIEPSKYHF